MISPSPIIFFIITACTASTLHIIEQQCIIYKLLRIFRSSLSAYQLSQSHHNWPDVVAFSPISSMESLFLCLWIHSCIFACEDVHVHSPVAHMRHCCSPTSPYIVDTTACIKEGVSWYRATRSLSLRCINVMYKKDSCLVWACMLLTFTPTNRRFG